MNSDTLPSSFFIKNRSKLKDLLLPSSAVILSSSRLYPRNGDLLFPFRQSSDLYYLTGIKQDSCTLVLFPGNNPGDYQEVLYIPEKNLIKEKWDGPRLSFEDASEISGIRDVRSLNTIIEDLREMLGSCRYVYFGSNIDQISAWSFSNEHAIRMEFDLALKTLEEHSLEPLMVKIRMYKEAEEIAMMKRAIEITGEAFIKVLSSLKPGMAEYEIAALISYVFQMNGSEVHAFDPIVAAGKNALTLHYVSNKGLCRDGDLLLMDFGADWQYYAADISRTIPINGRYSLRQRQLYEANLRVMNKAMELMVPGKTLVTFNEEVGELWEEEHVNLGLYSMQERMEYNEIEPLWKRYYWHGTSHSIGIDVHDRYDHSEKFRAGLVMSCEPGIYVPEEGVGIRLENDILITDHGAVNLSAEIPIDPDAIEVIMNR